MSRKAYSVWEYTSNTKTNPIPPAKSQKKQKQTVGVPQGQQPILWHGQILWNRRRKLNKRRAAGDTPAAFLCKSRPYRISSI